ncbi:hypothetical protein BDV96DRAFT_576870 [Lophiotrema nucula]|uniref:DUF3074 domain-containing protein n=1 Tax=Lophiotrema nucula TaxID=690887 RepID=A0A6A5Z4X0_9PLEO|nr:hypothetical protein BDV96DRAFT_576870 [Lophiotrema nucula]
MSELQKALESLRPVDYEDVPLTDLKSYLSDLFSNAELIANSVPPPPNGTPYDTAKPTRTTPAPATSAADLTVSNVRRPAPAPHHAELQKSWGKPLKLGAKEQALGISVFKMAGHDRHGAWFARTSVHEGLGFAKWKRAMMREFPESLAVQGGPGEGNIRGIGGDKRLEDITVEGIGKLEVYQLSAQFPGPTSPREFITLLLTSENGLSEESKVGNQIPRHWMVVSIPVRHPDAPLRDGLVRGQYESVEMIREIPLSHHKNAASSTPDLLNHEHHQNRNRSSTVGFAESRGVDAKGEKIDKHEAEEAAERNPVEWIMITRSDPGGGIPRFMVERGTPSSIVQDAGKFLDWACSKDDLPPHEIDEAIAEESSEFDTQHSMSVPESNGILAGVGTSIVDNASYTRRHSHLATDNSESTGIFQSLANTVGSYVPDSMNPLQRSTSNASSSTVSSVDSFASAEQFNTAPEGLSLDDTAVTPSTTSEKSLSPSMKPFDSSATGNSNMSRELEKIEQKRQQLKDKLEQAREKQRKETEGASTKTAKELERATDKHNRERKKQEDKFAKEVQKLEERRERETKKLLERQKKEADKNSLQKVQRERDEWKEKADLAEQENKLLKEQIGELQRENTTLVAKLGKTESGRDILKKVRDEMDGKGRGRASSRASSSSKASRNSDKKNGPSHSHSHSQLVHEEQAPQ